MSRDTISRWVTFVLQSSGITVNIFKPHSTRSASTFKAELSDAPSADILDKAGWKSESTFANFLRQEDCGRLVCQWSFAQMCSLVWNYLLLACASVFDVSCDPSVVDKVEYRIWTKLTGSWSSTGIPPLLPYTEGLHACSPLDPPRYLLPTMHMEGGVRVRGDAVLRCFWCGFSEIFFLTYGIAVFQGCAVCGNLKF